MSLHPTSITITVEPDKIIADRTGMHADLVKDTVTTKTIVEALNALLRESCNIYIADIQFTESDFHETTFSSLGVYALYNVNTNYLYGTAPLRVWIVKKTSDDVRRDPNSSPKDLYLHRLTRQFTHETFMVIRRDSDHGSMPYIAESRQELLQVYPHISDALNNFCNRAKHGDMCVFGQYTVIRLRNQI